MKGIITIAFIFVFQLINAQSGIIIPRYIKMPKDSVISKQIISSLNGFLLSAQENTSANPYILPSQLIETNILLDEFKGIEKSRKFKDEHFFKPYLDNIVEIDKDKYLIQISHIGAKDSISYLRSVFDIIAYRNNDAFLFSSPLIEYTKSWKTKNIGNITVHYKDRINENKVKDFVKTQKQFDNMLNIENGRYDIYCCSNANEVQKISGAEIKLDYNGRNNLSLSYNQNQKTLMITTNFGEYFDDFDPHDLFHWRAVKAIPRETYNHYMVCGCAYIYGGSWGISWEEIKEMFKTKMLDNTKKDWLKLYIERYNFGESREKHLLVTQFINALIIEKVQNEKGDAGIIQLLNTGSFRRNKEQFFNNLDKITGINEDNFNEKVSALVKNEYGKK